MPKAITYIDLFSGIGGFREGLSRAGGFVCVGHCEIDKYADQSYRALFDTKGEWFREDIREADPDEMPDFDLLCGGFPCQSFSIAGHRGGFADPRGTLFFEIARLTAAKRPAYLLLENVPGLLNHDGGRTFAAILHTLDGLGYGMEWQVLNSKDFDVPQARRRVYIVGYLDARCAGKILPFRETNDAAPAALRDGAQGSRVYDPAGVSCTLSASCGGFGGRTGLYDVSGGVPIKEATKKGYKMAYPGDSIDLAYPRMNTRRGRVGRQTAHTLTTDATQGTLTFIDLNADPRQTKLARCINTRQDAGIHKHRGECSGVLEGKRIRRLTPRECLRLQGWHDEQIDQVLAIQSDNQVYKQAGNGVTVTVVEAIGRRLAAVHNELEAMDKG